MVARFADALQASRINSRQRNYHAPGGCQFEDGVDITRHVGSQNNKRELYSSKHMRYLEGLASFLRCPHQEFEHVLPLLNSFPIGVAMSVSNMTSLFPIQGNSHYRLGLDPTIP
jgi:hypothetical protein